MDAAIVGLTYLTSETLISGDNYELKIQARNTVGYSLFSETIIVRVARIPDIPTEVETAINLAERTITFSWLNPYDGGSPIFEYFIEIL